MKCSSQRCLDLLEILHTSAARDAECKDANHSAFFWNISQNASKEKHRSAVPGIASCITPDGDVFLPHAGRPLLGCKKLLLQGIPFFPLILGNETEVQLGDLAGNAMSLTVVCATMLAAVTCKQLRKDHERSMDNNIAETLREINKGAPTLASLASKSVSDEAVPTKQDIVDTKTLFSNLAEISEAAITSSIHCTCETSGKMSNSANFLQCRICSIFCCRDCIHAKQGYQFESHDMEEVVFSKEDRDISAFEVKLRSIMPANLIFCKEGIAEVASEKDKYRVGALYLTFGLHRIKRSRHKWTVVYYARENGVGEAIAEFRITVGQLERRTATADAVIGVQGELTSFLPARKDPLVLGALSPCVMGRQCHGDSELKWVVKAESTEQSLSLVGNNAMPSFRTEVGLTDDAAKSLTKHATTTRKKEFGAAKGHGDERRWIYPNNWKEWPEKITIMDDQASTLGGTYERTGCKHTFNQNACWIRKKTTSEPELYLLIKPDVSRVGPDIGMLSTSSDHNDTTSVLATLRPQWQPCDALNQEEQKVKANLLSWAPLQKMSCSSLKQNLTVDAPREDTSPVIITMSGLSDSDMSDLCCRDDESGSEQIVHLNVHRGAKAQQTVRRFNLVCVAKFLQHAAANGLKYGLGASWIPVKPKNAPFGCCEVTLPPRLLRAGYSTRSVMNGRDHPSPELLESFF